MEWAPVLRQLVKTHFSLNGEGSHDRVSQKVHEGVQRSRGKAVGTGCLDRRSGACVGALACGWCGREGGGVREGAARGGRGGGRGGGEGGQRGRGGRGGGGAR